MSWAGCQINPIDLNFHLQKVWKFLKKIQLTKSDLTNTYIGIKMPCPVPNRVNVSENLDKAAALPALPWITPPWLCLSYQFNVVNKDFIGIIKYLYTKGT